MTARAVLAQQMTEDQLLSQVLELCAWLGVTTAHFRPARTVQGWRTAVSGDGKGFPDLVLVAGGQLVFRELKSESGQLDPGQRRWRDVLQRHGQDWGLWRPSQWLDGEIRAELDALTIGVSDA